MRVTGNYIFIDGIIEAVVKRLGCYSRDVMSQIYRSNLTEDCNPALDEIYAMPW